MRRKDREITDINEITKIIAKGATCLLATNDEEVPYVIGTDVEDEQLYLYFHSTNVSTKLDLIRKDNKATFEMNYEYIC